MVVGGHVPHYNIYVCVGVDALDARLHLGIEVVPCLIVEN